MPDGRVGFIDFGRVGWVSERNRARVFDLMLAFVEADEAAATDVLASMVSAGPQLDVASLQRDLGQLVDAYQRSGLDIDLQELFESFLTVVREQGLQVPSDYVVLLTTLAMLQRVAKHMATDYRLTDTVAAYALSRRWRLSPEQLMRGAHRTWRATSICLDDLPVGLSRAAATGEASSALAVRPSGATTTFSIACGIS
jgi:ubiquinone biosynthesis protein